MHLGRHVACAGGTFSRSELGRSSEPRTLAEFHAWTETEASETSACTTPENALQLVSGRVAQSVAAQRFSASGLVVEGVVARAAFRSRCGPMRRWWAARVSL